LTDETCGEADGHVDVLINNG